MIQVKYGGHQRTGACHIRQTTRSYRMRYKPNKGVINERRRLDNSRNRAERNARQRTQRQATQHTRGQTQPYPQFSDWPIFPGGRKHFDAAVFRVKNMRFRLNTSFNAYCLPFSTVLCKLVSHVRATIGSNRMQFSFFCATS